MSTYIDEVKAEKKFIGNVVIQIVGNALLDENGEAILDELGFPIMQEDQYFSIRIPDSGLTIPFPQNKMISSLVLNPTSVDLRRVSTTVASYSFRLIDKEELVTSIIGGDASGLIGRSVNIFIGRKLSHLGGNMDFADYFQLPPTKIKKIDFADNAYNFTTNEETDRIDKTIYDFKSALAVDILTGTTTFTMRDLITDFPTAGFLKVDDEFVSYSGKDLINNRFTGVIRGELNSTVATHSANADCVLVETVTDNPLNIILKILISNGGGGTYDTLQDGLGIDQNLVDIALIEALRDSLFFGRQFTLSLYNIDSALKLIEDEFLMPNNLRFTYSINSKLTLIVLDRAVFVESVDVIDENSIVKFPKWSVDSNKVVNQLEIQWDFNEGTNMFAKRDTPSDASSIAKYGAQDPLKLSFKGIKSTLDGQNIIDDFAKRLLARLSIPTPEIQINTHVDKSLQTIGDKARLESSKIPNVDGTLNFASELEIVSRAVNHQTGDVQFKLAFTSFTNIRSCYIAPSDTMITIVSQSEGIVATGRGAFYQVGWKMLLWDNTLNQYAPDAVNEIASITGDNITFVDPWTTVLTPGDFRLKFADYDDCVDTQKRYCFISDDGNNFDDGKPTYRITF